MNEEESSLTAKKSRSLPTRETKQYVRNIIILRYAEIRGGSKVLGKGGFLVGIIR